ncbi:4-hydroxy-tetrahydrodipicolinate reductase [Elusimicrobiota bacterium]
MIRISINGARGRMGQNLIELVSSDEGLQLCGLIESNTHADIGMTICGIELVSDIEKGIRDSDVVIDFSYPQAVVELLPVCLKLKKKLVIGTTGFDSEQISGIEKAAAQIPVFISPNMSVGVNLFFKIAGQITDNLPGYEKEIIETHHNKKVDAPSGTAKKLAQIISRDGDTVVSGRDGKVGPRSKNEIGMHVVRAGNIVGEHTVMWVNPHERIEFSHKAQSRQVFAAGAISAAKWINGVSAGSLYSMEDILN